MQQRRVRLGDILDDYCPRERRVTNHVVVAMVGDEVKHTRCSTCEVDHEYKHARVPAARKKKDGVLAAKPGDVGHLRPVTTPDESGDAAAFDESDDYEVLTIEETTAVVLTAPVDAPPADEPEMRTVGHAEPQPAREEDDGPVHRRLIRATLPRQEGQTPEWKEPDFTVRQSPRGGFDREIDGNRAPGAGGRHRRRGRGGRPDGQSAGARGPQGNGNQWGGGSGHGGRGQGNGNRQGAPSGQRGGRPHGGSQHGPRQGQGGGRKRGR